MPTDQTKQLSDGQALPPPAELVIARHDSVARNTLSAPEQAYSSYYIFYLDEHGEELTDLCEQTLSGALAQAKAEFGIEPDEWTIVDEADAVASSISQ